MNQSAPPFAGGAPAPPSRSLQDSSPAESRHHRQRAQTRHQLPRLCHRQDPRGAVRQLCVDMYRTEDFSAAHCVETRPREDRLGCHAACHAGFWGAADDARTHAGLTRLVWCRGGDRRANWMTRRPSLHQAQDPRLTSGGAPQSRLPRTAGGAGDHRGRPNVAQMGFANGGDPP